MEKDQKFIKYAKLVLYTIFTVIIAGSIVRTTHSGMGCPDWPHCFGRWIPPLNAGQLPKDFEKYLSKQDIDHSFNAFHTWIEYINRLLTVLLGIFIIILNIKAFVLYFKKRRSIFWLSFSLFLLVGFEAWVGKVVVNSNLSVWTITAHMIPALVIAAICVYMIHLLEKRATFVDATFKRFIWLAFILVFIQILIGTEVRAEVDTISKAMKYTDRHLWLKQVGGFLQAHEVFAWVTALSVIVVAGKAFAHKGIHRVGLLLLLLIFGEVFLGLIMTQLSMPAFAQPLHLLLSSILIVTLFYLLLRITRK